MKHLIQKTPFLVYFGIFIAFLSCENDPADINRIASRNNLSIEIGVDVEILYSDSAQVRVKIKGDTLLNYLDKNKPRREFPAGVAVDFYGGTDSPESRLTAKYAIQYEHEGRIVARDSVVLVSKRNEKLETEELIWDEKKEIIFTNKFVKVQTPEEVMMGYGLEASQDFKKWKIKKVTGNFQIESLDDNINN